MGRFLSLKVWTANELALLVFCSIGVLVLFALLPGEFFTTSGATAGIIGGIALQHFSLHGWTLFSGTVGQRLLLASFWFVAIVCGGLMATLLGL